MHTHKSFLAMLIYSESSHKDTYHVYRLRSVNNTGAHNKGQVLITKCSLSLLYVTWIGFWWHWFKLFNFFFVLMLLKWPKYTIFISDVTNKIKKISNATILKYRDTKVHIKCIENIKQICYTHPLKAQLATKMYQHFKYKVGNSYDLLLTDRSFLTVIISLQCFLMFLVCLHKKISVNSDINQASDDQLRYPKCLLSMYNSSSPIKYYWLGL